MEFIVAVNWLESNLEDDEVAAMHAVREAVLREQAAAKAAMLAELEEVIHSFTNHKPHHR